MLSISLKAHHITSYPFCPLALVIKPQQLFKLPGTYNLLILFSLPTSIFLPAKLKDMNSHQSYYYTHPQFFYPRSYHHSYQVEWVLWFTGHSSLVPKVPSTMSKTGVLAADSSCRISVEVKFSAPGSCNSMVRTLIRKK